MSNYAAKYDRLAEGFSERTYTNLEFHAFRRFIVATRWGRSLEPGDSILELGCGDGYVAQYLAQYGLRYRGVDISANMVAASERRLHESGLHADFVVADVRYLQLPEPFDAVVSYMGSFFAYVDEPLAVLERLRPYVRKKIIVDLSPRHKVSLQSGLTMLRQAGFRHVTWRPFFVPQERPLPAWVLRLLVFCEDIPWLRTIPLRWKFHCLLKGEP